MMGKNTLSLCLITKNNEIDLNERCSNDFLNDIKCIADEVIIADLKDFCNDLSRIKNTLMDKAQGRWILFLESNETISVDQYEKIRKLLANPNAEGYLLHTNCSLAKERIISPIENLRLIRKRSEYRFEYKAFEHIPDKFITNIMESDIVICRNDDKNYEFQREKLYLLEEELTNRPDDSYLLYICGIQLLNEGRYEEGVNMLQKSIDKVFLEYLFAPHLFKCLGYAYIMIGKDDEALRILNEGIEFFPLYYDFLVLRSEVYKKNKNYKEAFENMGKALKIASQPLFVAPLPEISTAYMMETLENINKQL